MAPSAHRAPRDPNSPVATFSHARLAFGSRVLWEDLNLTISPGEFVAVLGPNGSGKTSFLRCLLGQYGLDAGQLEVTDAIGYIPQQHADDSDPMAMRGRDLVGFGVDGARWGIGLRGRGRRRQLVDAALAEVGATAYADAPMGLLSGGEQQRLRVAQSLTSDPALLLCDEPLSSLDPTNQHRVVELIDERRRSANTAIVFVTHEINPILPYVDRVLYLVGGRFRIGTPDEVMTTATLSNLYGSDVEVLRVNGRLVVIGGEDGHHCEEHADPPVFPAAAVDPSPVVNAERDPRA
ncbi:ATP-binding cassette domain-containing protein [Gordonia sp. HNM0687]|uniref:ATP-binding cassette domain-containing protein n=1 Tax=Gordonia mangrovi TaxID=2665643 RepID=A0A6L7GKH8_9ACTN|nr:metal ABC transporter ATP-binding protein [Gordonia mangrovi]MXP19983.1 ATP-binding cassette domain-containing protein [Gordonia mangrovi]UVF79400.1 metal ABC transporter ATP-binding protein [Gordonia mangrovi]